MFADPGCGKSVLARSLVDDELRDTDKHSICYFFFKDNEDQNNVSTALCALLHQLFGKRPQLLRYATTSWQWDGGELQQELDALWRIFIAAATDCRAGSITCVLDALDECRERERIRLISFLNQFYTRSFRSDQRGYQLKFLVTSRPYDEIVRGFRGIPDHLPTIRLLGEEQNDKISEEINKVIDFRVSKIAR